MSDTEDLFNFIPVNQPILQDPEQRRLGLSRKRSNPDQVFFQFIKKPVVRGTKIIKIEIYDVDSFPKSRDMLCNCQAEVCAQHIVKTTLFDDIYSSTRDLIAKIQDDMETNPS